MGLLHPLQLCTHLPERAYAHPIAGGKRPPAADAPRQDEPDGAQMSLERNLLIEAGAGTGKTTRLVKTVLQALFIRQIPLEAIVALTFTNKAAGELKERVGSALEDVLAATSIETLRKKPWWPSPEP